MNYNELKYEELETLAEKGDGKAFGIMAFHNENKGNYKEAVELYRKAAASLDPYGLTVMGELLCFEKEGFNEDYFVLDEALLQYVEPDFSKGLEYLQKACELKSVYALEVMAIFYCYGHGECEVDYEAAKKYAEEAIALGYEDAVVIYGAILNAIGCCISEGEGEYEKDEKKGVEYFIKAAELSEPNPEALFNLGMAYFNGEGTERSLSKAKKYIKLASEKGNADAQDFLKKQRF